MNGRLTTARIIMKHVIELTASEINGSLYVHMRVYVENVPRWSRTFQLYKITAERIMNIYYEYYLYVPLLLCSQDQLDDCKQLMSKWLRNYKKRHDINGIANWRYELEY